MKTFNLIHMSVNHNKSYGVLKQTAQIHNGKHENNQISNPSQLQQFKASEKALRIPPPNKHHESTCIEYEPRKEQHEAHIQAQIASSPY